MSYLLLKHIHVSTAVITAVLFMLRLGLDAGGHRWRHTALRWIPHANDTLLLAAAIGLWITGGWNPLNQHWLAMKIVLLVVYILAGKQALTPERAAGPRIGFAVLALLILAMIFAQALYKPW